LRPPPTRLQAAAYELAVYAPGPWNCALPAGRCRDVLRLGVGPLLHRVLSNMGAAAGAPAAGAEPAGLRGGGGAAPPAPSPAGGGADADTALPAEGGAASGKDGGSGGRSEGGGKGDRSGGGGGVAARPRLFLFSGHDSTVHALLAALGQEATTWAPFTANIAFELWRAAPGGGVGRRDKGAGSKEGGSSDSGQQGSGDDGKEGGGGASSGGGGGGRDKGADLKEGGSSDSGEEGSGDDGKAGGGSASSGGGGGGGGEWWVRVLYNGRPLPALGGRGRGALLSREQEEEPFPGAPPQASGPGAPDVAEWRRSRQLETGAGGEDGAAGGGGGEAGGAPGGGAARGGGVRGSGWIRLTALRERLRPVTASDEEKAAACWPGQSLD
jgi:hypothetical protein